MKTNGQAVNVIADKESQEGMRHRRITRCVLRVQENTLVRIAPPPSWTVCGASRVGRKLLVALVMTCQTFVHMVLAEPACGGGADERHALGVMPKVVDKAKIAVDHRPKNVAVGAVGDKVER